MVAKWKDVLAATELCPGDVRELSHQGVDLLIFRAMAARCPHMGNYIPNGLPTGEDLSRLLQGEELVCPFHNWRFDGLGYCTGIPSGQRIPAKVSNGERIGTSWPVREIDGVIQIEWA